MRRYSCHASWQSFPMSDLRYYQEIHQSLQVTVRVADNQLVQGIVQQRLLYHYILTSFSFLYQAL